MFFFSLTLFPILYFISRDYICFLSTLIFNIIFYKFQVYSVVGIYSIYAVISPQ